MKLIVSSSSRISARLPFPLTGTETLSSLLIVQKSKGSEVEAAEIVVDSIQTLIQNPKSRVNE